MTVMAMSMFCNDFILFTKREQVSPFCDVDNLDWFFYGLEKLQYFFVKRFTEIDPEVGILIALYFFGRRFINMRICAGRDQCFDVDSILCNFFNEIHIWRNTDKDCRFPAFWFFF